MKKVKKGLSFALLIILSGLVFGVEKEVVEASIAAFTPSPYLYNFDVSGVVFETSNINLTSSPYWWVNSGAYLKIKDGRGGTNLGDLDSSNPWRLLYATNNPIDTDNGVHPQNIFRLLTRQPWGNARSEVYFVIRKNNISQSPNRNSSNGLLLMNRYQDSDNLYYAGVRVDGSAVIKKKKNGIYYTLALEKGVYEGVYNKDVSPNLLPKNRWIGLRLETKNIENGKVELSLYLDKLWQGDWQLVAEAIDDGLSYGGASITKEGIVGIRTDFMDAEFENFRIRNL